MSKLGCLKGCYPLFNFYIWHLIDVLQIVTPTPSEIFRFAFGKTSLSYPDFELFKLSDFFFLFRKKKFKKNF